MATRTTAGRRERVVGAPADQRQLVAKLMHRGPDVVEELDLDDRLQAARGHADGAADDVGLGQRRVEDALAAVLALQAGGELEDSALAFDLLVLQVFFAAAVGNVFAEHDDARVAPHLVLQAGVDEIGHGAVAGLDVTPVLRGRGMHGFGLERVRGGIEVGRIDELLVGIGRREGRSDRAVAASCTSASTSFSSWLIPFSSRMPSRIRNNWKRLMGSRSTSCITLRLRAGRASRRRRASASRAG